MLLVQCLCHLHLETRSKVLECTVSACFYVKLWLIDMGFHLHVCAAFQQAVVCLLDTWRL